MNSLNFLKGVGFGLVIGAAAGFAMQPKKKAGATMRRTLKTVGDTLESLADAMGL